MLRPSAREFKKIVGNNPVKMLELGVWVGANALELYNNFNIELLYLMDKWYEHYEKYHFPQIVNFPKMVMDKFYNKDNVIIIRSDTLKFDLFPDNYFDYIYLDDNHSYEHVRIELEKYYKCLTSVGMLCGDNYEMKGVEKAVTEFALKRDCKVKTEPWKKEGATDWWMWK